MSRSQKERPGDYFASMTDLLVGVLFILIIMVAYLAFQINTEDRVPKTAYDAIKKERDAAEQKILSLEKEVSDLLSQIERLRRDLRGKPPLSRANPANPSKPA